MDYLYIFLHDLWERPIHDKTRRPAVALVHPTHPNIEALAHRRSGRRYSRRRERYRHETKHQELHGHELPKSSREKRHQGARNKFVTSFRTSCAHQSPGKCPCRKISRFQDGSISTVDEWKPKPITRCIVFSNYITTVIHTCELFETTSTGSFQGDIPSVTLPCRIQNASNLNGRSEYG